MSTYPVTPDGRYFVVRGRLWRCSNPELPDKERQRLTAALMAARRAKGIAMRAGDEDGRERARQQVDATKIALGERGPVWWTDGTPDMNRHLVKNTSYVAWFAAIEVQFAQQLREEAGLLHGLPERLTKGEQNWRVVGRL